MSSLRVYQLAKQMGVSSKELVNLLQDNGVEVRNHMSVLDDDTVEIVRQTFQAHVADAAEVDEGKSADDDDEAGRKKKKKGRKGAVKKGKMLEYEEGMTVRNLADKLTIAPSIAVSDIISLGHMLSINHPVPFELAREVAKKHGVEIIEAVDLMVEEEMVEEEPEELVSRPPVVTVMGHVDHGKTTLLDAIRETHVADREAGGITQHIGASVADVNGQRIVFVDTPGHEAFTAMRSRGAQVTDLVILVVAADDGLMPQTIEAINHSKAAGVPIVVAINKIDKPGINMDRIKQDLAKHDLLPEEWGGQTTICEVSAKTRQGL
ncbi:translation initiation factor IF-2 N-terminal domain-containing protein, partial [bacterium]|nr:translation initiation factor IF-2 N-terminal domain-containing protein [candidate division CSSED10-310 bacterium]